MSKKITFKLVDETLNQQLGTITFDGSKLHFKLDENVTQDQWSRIGVIVLNNDRRSTSGKPVLYYINSRLPLSLRKADLESKLAYIAESGLRVASDSFALLSADK